MGMSISHAPADYRCPFCQLVNGSNDPLSNQADIVYQTERVTAFVSSHQWRGNAPNVLVVPNQHFENVYTLPADLGADIQKAISVVAIGLKTALSLIHI